MLSLRPAAVKAELPTRLGHYTLEAEIGRGGIGAVYRACDVTTNRVVALKTLERSNLGLVALFEREYHTLALLRHPCVIDVYDFGIGDDGRRYYTMELLEGQDMYTLSPLPWKKACEHVRDIATSLALLHTRRLVHRDISPRNVRLNNDGRAKLLDFGAISPFGTADKIVGTPICIAPETARRFTLDQRSDLFALGVLTYWTLARRVPFAVRKVRDAEHAWHTPPKPLSELVADIPPDLDQLVLSMISIDPMGRPASAAEVIDRIVAIAGLDDKPLVGVAESHLLSSHMVGREREAEQLQKHLLRTLRGTGGLVVVEGASGVGRSRLMSNLLIEARLAGMTTLCIDALSHPESNGLLRALAQSLMEVAPAEATETLPAHLPVLGQVIGELKTRTRVNHPPRAVKLPRDPAERRMRIQTAMANWIVDVAERKPMLLVVDDAHAVDEDSAGTLIVLAHAAQNTHLLLVATHLLGAESPVAVRQLMRISARVKLHNLSSPDVEQLVVSIFGDVPYRARLSQWLSSVVNGNPAQCLEMLRGLVDRNVIRYEGGAWLLPAELPESDLPATLEDALSRRLAQLQPTTLELARVLSLHRGLISLPLCRHLLPEIDRSEVYATIDELVAREILTGFGDTYRLTYEAFRTILLADLDVEQLRGLHLRLGKALIKLREDLFVDGRSVNLRNANASDLGIALQVGWHLLHGGDSVRGRYLLRTAGLELAHLGDGLAQAVPALEEALAAYRKEGRSRYECAYLMTPLALAGTYTDWRLSYRYGEELLDAAAEGTGINLARRLERWFGGHLALGIALTIALPLFWSTARRYIARTLRECFVVLLGLASAVMGTYAVLLDRRRSEQMLERLKPLRFFPRSHAVGLAHDFLVAMLDVTNGCFSAAWNRARRALEYLQRPNGVSGLPEDARVQLEVGFHILIATLDVMRTDGSVHRTLEMLRRHSTSMARLTEAGTLNAYHTYRGERVRAVRFQREVDMLAAQTGSTWSQDVLTARNLWWVYALCEDVIGLKCTVRQLEVLAATTDIQSIIDTRDAAHACYLAERGMAAEALVRYSQTFESTTREPTVFSMRFVGAYARVLRAAGETRKARDICKTALDRLPKEEFEFVCAVHGARLEYALCTAELGDHERAAEFLERLLDEQKDHDNPLVIGLMHKARARVALLQKDEAVFDHHLALMQQWFKRTDNPALVVQCQKLADDGRRSGLRVTVQLYSLRPDPIPDRNIAEVNIAFAACHGPAERLQVALDLVVDKARAERGYLYLLEPDGLKFVAPTVGLEPPEELRLELQNRIELLYNEMMETIGGDDTQPEELATVVETCDDLWAKARLTEQQSYLALHLTFPRGEDEVVVGAVALVQGDEPIKAVDVEFLMEVARSIYDAGDIQTVYFAASSASLLTGDAVK